MDFLILLTMSILANKIKKNFITKILNYLYVVKSLKNLIFQKKSSQISEFGCFRKLKND